MKEAHMSQSRINKSQMTEAQTKEPSMKKMVSTIHRIAAIAAFLMILSFFTSSLLVEVLNEFWPELLGGQSAIVAVKAYIANAVWLLILLMIVTGLTGNKMAPKVKGGPIGSKKKRMPIIALNGLLVLLPAALYLNHLATVGQFDTWFYSIQAVELLAGGINLSLMALNIRDGVRMVRARNQSVESRD